MESSTPKELDSSMPHIGELLFTLTRKMGVTGTNLAAQIGLKHNSSISAYLQNQSLHAKAIWNISIALGYNIFRDLANALDKQIPPNNGYSTDPQLIEKDKRIAELEKELSIYKEIVGVGRK